MSDIYVALISNMMIQPLNIIDRLYLGSAEKTLNSLIMRMIYEFFMYKMQGFHVNLLLTLHFLRLFIMLACSTSSTALAAARSILIQLRFAAL